MRALLTVADKRGILPLASTLAELGWELLATDGTAALLAEHGLPVLSTTDWTELPSMLDGRVKTLNHKVFAALLCCRDRTSHTRETAAAGIVPLDLIAGNFHHYHDGVLDTIDIGGPAMMRAAAKNHPWVIPLADPDDYPPVARALRAAHGDPAGVGLPARQALAGKAFRLLADLDNTIATTLAAAPAGER